MNDSPDNVVGGNTPEFESDREEPHVTLRKKIEKALEGTLNSVSAEQTSNTPDFILAKFLSNCLAAFDEATLAREKWYNVELQPLQEYHSQFSSPVRDTRRP